jgi:hypothetical protein
MSAGWVHRVILVLALFTASTPRSDHIGSGSRQSSDSDVAGKRNSHEFRYSLIAGLLGGAQSADPKPESSVRSVLQKGAYPWYDAQEDRVKPLLPDSSSLISRLGKRLEAFFDWLDHLLFGNRSRSSSGGQGSVGGAVTTLIFLASGVVLLFVLWRLWKLHEPQGGATAARSSRIGEAARVAGLAPELSMLEADPWSEAVRRRAAGDLAGAVIWLFLDQLLALERAGFIRLTPGKTARQYVHSVQDAELRDGLRTTLGVFENVYYGHRAPEPEALERTWACALDFRNRLRTITVAQ